MAIIGLNYFDSITIPFEDFTTSQQLFKLFLTDFFHIIFLGKFFLRRVGEF